MLADLLNLTTVVVTRETATNDGMGGQTLATASTTLTRAALWEVNSNTRQLSDRLTKDSSHVLATVPSYYSWNDDDKYVTYNGYTFDVTGKPDNVMQLGEVLVVGLRVRS